MSRAYPLGNDHKHRVLAEVAFLPRSQPIPAQRCELRLRAMLLRNRNNMQLIYLFPVSRAIMYSNLHAALDESIPYDWSAQARSNEGGLRDYA